MGRGRGRCGVRSFRLPRRVAVPDVRDVRLQSWHGEGSPGTGARCGEGSVTITAPVDDGGILYVEEYLERYGDLCSSVVVGVIRKRFRGAKVCVVGPQGVDIGLLRRLAVGGGGFGVSDDVREELRVRVREYLSGGGRAAMFELPASDAAETLAGELFPAMTFAPSHFGVSDGKSWTMYPSGVCGYLTSANHEDEVLREVLEASAWGNGIVFLLSLRRAVSQLLDSGVVWNAEMLGKLFLGLDAVLVPAHNREATVIVELQSRE